jgi:hypothetical protein
VPWADDDTSADSGMLDVPSTSVPAETGDERLDRSAADAG